MTDSEIAEMAETVDAARRALRLSVLRYMAASAVPEQEFMSFSRFERDLGLPRALVCGVLQDLSARGYARYGRGLWAWDGTGPAGAGYTVTTAGLDMVAAICDKTIGGEGV